MKTFQSALCCTAAAALACGILTGITGTAEAADASPVSPADTTDLSGPMGSAVLSVAQAAAPSVTALAVTESGDSGSPVDLSATVTYGPTAPQPGLPITDGTVSFYDNGAATPLNGTPVPVDASGAAAYDIPAGLAAGQHSIVAVYTPADTTAIAGSQSTAQQFALVAGSPDACAQSGSQCTDASNITATVPVGTLAINTPYTAANPVNFGQPVLDPGLTEFTGSADVSGIAVIDSRAGDLPWTVSALAGILTNGGTGQGSAICGQNIGLQSLTSTPGTGFAGTVTVFDNPAASPPVAPTGTSCPTSAGGLVGSGGTGVPVATATQGLGTDTLAGTLTLTAPVATQSGVFAGIITFTVG